MLELLPLVAHMQPTWSAATIGGAQNCRRVAYRGKFANRSGRGRQDQCDRWENAVARRLTPQPVSRKRSEMEM
jgi:hypothetical protein